MAIVSVLVCMGIYFDAFKLHFESLFQNMSNLSNDSSSIQSAIQLRAGLIEAIQFYNQAKE